jgi:DNA repair exonuclease SbcCD ATPase subunit
LSEATTEPAIDAPAREMKPWYFGSPTQVDPREAGRKGGTTPRRSKLERQLREKIVETKNGQAAWSLLRVELERQQARDQAVYAKDRELAELDEMMLGVREELEAALAELRRLDEQLEQRRAQLEAARLDKVALAAYLRELGEDRVAEACDANGWIERESESDAVE